MAWFCPNRITSGLNGFCERTTVNTSLACDGKRNITTYIAIGPFLLDLNIRTTGETDLNAWPEMFLSIEQMDVCVTVSNHPYLCHR